MKESKRIKLEKELRDIGRRIRRLIKKVPNGNIYVACHTMNLCSGPHHLDCCNSENKSGAVTPNYDAVIADVGIPGIDGGDW